MDYFTAVLILVKSFWNLVLINHTHEKGKFGFSSLFWFTSVSFDQSDLIWEIVILIFKLFVTSFFIYKSLISLIVNYLKNYTSTRVYKIIKD